MSLTNQNSCIICSLPLTAKQIKSKQTCALQSTGLSKLLGIEIDVELRERLINIASVEPKLSYHRACWKRVIKVGESVNEAMPMIDIEHPICLTPQHPVTTLPIWSVDQCGFARSHADYLSRVAQSNGLTILPTQGGGHCFYNSVELCLKDLGVSFNIWQLRAITADQLIRDRDIHGPVYQADNPEDRGQFVQARTYDAYIAGTRTGNEWATEMCVYSLAKALNIVIRVISTLDIRNKQVSAMTRDYVDGVTSNTFIAVGYNKASEHYVGIGQRNRAPLTQFPLDYTKRSVQRVPVAQADLSDISSPIDLSVNVTDAVESMSFADSCIILNTSTSDDHCINCKRQNTEECQLHLQICSGTFIKRRYSNITAAQGRESFALCGDCRIFLNVNPSTSKNFWAHGWPSVITHLLINNGIRHSLWHYLSSVHCKSLSALAHDLRLSTESNSVFVDNTQAVSCFDDRVKSGVISDFLLNMKTTCFPSVKCPAGCMEFIDKCIAIPFNHFIAWKFGISIHNGTSDYFNGARLDWPSCSIELSKFPVNPGLIVTERGLCVMMCENHIKGLPKPIIHVPLNPILKEGLPYPDIDAAATPSPML